jgi:phosphoglucosamine mutase
VLEQMLERGWMLGGENSGHLICRDKHTTATASSPRSPVLRAMIEQRVDLAEAAAPLKLFPQRLINVPVPARLRLAHERPRAGGRARGDACARQRRAACSCGPSGTEPVLRVMVEARERGLADQHAEALAHVIAEAAGQRL